VARIFSSQRLRELRLAAGFKPEQLAMRVDRSVWAVHQYERGLTQPSASVLGRLADVLGCNVDDLFVRQAVRTDAA
jgi:transcriptional regulator with XRE-family HTH domain